MESGGKIRLKFSIDDHIILATGIRISSGGGGSGGRGRGVYLKCCTVCVS